MSFCRCFTICLLLVTLAGSAASLRIPTLNVGPITYTGVRVLGANATDLYFTHDRGIGNVKLKYLSVELQKRFHFDPKEAAEAEQQQAEADALYQSTVISNMAAQAKALAEKNKSAKLPDSLADPISDKSLLGKTAPVLVLTNWVGEKPITEGKYLLLSFWAPWSAASRECVPQLNSLQKKFAEKLAVIGVTPPLEEETETVQSGLEFATATDAEAKTSAAAGIRSIPTVLLVDPAGIVLYEGHPAAITEKKLQALFVRSQE